ncbi:hypothetical protein CDAR_584431 [Caerostris darwini]|uniref:Uncharacterized protein n=1 Tax=Caerostris darwini TaxID=1538125 RepID=A0AAV4RQ19_9ARAC|nr:hypothetical protein CDAR_584431 [Caerostris darwini]
MSTPHSAIPSHGANEPKRKQKAVAHSPFTAIDDNLGGYFPGQYAKGKINPRNLNRSHLHWQPSLLNPARLAITVIMAIAGGLHRHFSNPFTAIDDNLGGYFPGQYAKGKINPRNLNRSHLHWQPSLLNPARLAITVIMAIAGDSIDTSASTIAISTQKPDLPKRKKKNGSKKQG